MRPLGVQVDDWLKDSDEVGPSWLTVDLTIFTLRDDQLMVLLVERGLEPFRGMPAMPGGYVQKNETLHDGALCDQDRQLALRDVRDLR